MISIIYNKVARIAMTAVKMGRHHVKIDVKSIIWGAAASSLLAVYVLLGAGAAQAAPKFVSCGGAAMLGGAQLNCSHLAPNKPSQLCNFSWSLLLPNNIPQVVSGSFLLPQGANNAMVYQGSGFVGSLTAPIILCADQHR
jgi:hypothetical protein